MMGLGAAHIEEVCLVDGEHEYNHTVAEEHSVEVVGYAESGVHTEWDSDAFSISRALREKLL